MNHMVLHPDKTKFMLTTTRQKTAKCSIISPPPPHTHTHSPLPPPLTAKGNTIEEVQNHRVLGVTIDNNLAWTPHVNTLCKKISTKVFQLSKIKKNVNFHARKIFFSAHIQSLIDYGSTLWDSASNNSLKPLHSLYRRALKLILKKQSCLEQKDYNLLRFYHYILG